MASQQPPPPPPPPPSGDAASPTTITSLSDDILREIFLRLPSLPSLIRAALACRTFLDAVRSSSDFRRRFRVSHPAPLLGLFFDPDDPAIPSFAPLRRRSDPDLAAAVRGGDFFLTLVSGDHCDAAPGWEIADCRGGRVLLSNPRTDQIAAYNPLTRALDLVPRLPEEITVGCRGYFTYLNRFILPSCDDDEDRGSLRVLCTCHDDSRARAAVFSSDTGEWQIYPWAHAFTRRRGDDKYWLYSGSPVNGWVYWTHTSKPYMLVLNIVTMQFSRIDLPRFLKGHGHCFRVGETKDGKPCIVGLSELILLGWYLRPDDNGVEKWMMCEMFRLQDVLKLTEGSPEEHDSLKVIAIIDGYVYLSTFDTFVDPNLSCWFMSFCLETGKLEMLFQKKYDSHVHPYIMPWPPALLAQPGSGKKPKKSQVTTVLNDYNYLEHKKKQSEKTMEVSVEKKNQVEENSIEKCLDTVDAMEELTDEEKAIAAEVFENDINRLMFMKQKNLNVRLIWLRRKISRLACT